jgi:hypothetical protein
MGVRGGRKTAEYLRPVICANHNMGGVPIFPFPSFSERKTIMKKLLLLIGLISVCIMAHPCLSLGCPTRCDTATYTHSTGDVVEFEVCNICGTLTEVPPGRCDSSLTKCYEAPFPFVGTDITVSLKVTPPDSTVNNILIQQGDRYDHWLSVWVASGSNGAGESRKKLTATSTQSVSTPLTLSITAPYIPYISNGTTHIDGMSFGYSRLHWADDSQQVDLYFVISPDSSSAGSDLHVE